VKAKMEIQDEYDFDYSKAKPNKYAQHFRESTIRVYDGEKLIKEMKPVLVDVDLIKHFKISEEVNNALRAVIEAIPKSSKKVI
jgi:hypothetical protein